MGTDRPDVDLDRVIHGTLFGEALINGEVAALLADENGNYIAANDRACALTGHSRLALTSFRAGELGADAASRRIYDNISRRRKLQGRKAVRCKDGAVVPCRYWAIPTIVSKLPYFVLLLWASPQAERTSA